MVGSTPPVYAPVAALFLAMGITGDVAFACGRAAAAAGDPGYNSSWASEGPLGA